METIKTPNLIIGFGKAGKTLAADLARHGERVVLAEESARMYGGTCINIGCIPSKKLIVEGQQGSRTADKEAVFSQAMQAKETLTTKLREANYHKVADLTGVDVINATAEFVDAHTVKLTGADGEKLVEADRIFINTGASPRRLNIEGADGNRIYDSTAMLSLPQRPTRLVIVGGGYISLEFACMYQAFGSHVTILETSDTFLAREDRDVAEEMLRVLTGKGIDVRLGARTERFVEGPEHTAVVTTVGTFEADAVLVGIGRQPNTSRLHLERAGVEVDARGFIVTDNRLHAAHLGHGRRGRESAVYLHLARRLPHREQPALRQWQPNPRQPGGRGHSRVHHPSPLPHRTHRDAGAGEGTQHRSEEDAGYGHPQG